MNANGLQIAAGRASRTNLALSAGLRIYKFLLSGEPHHCLCLFAVSGCQLFILLYKFFSS